MLQVFFNAAGSRLVRLDASKRHPSPHKRVLDRLIVEASGLRRIQVAASAATTDEEYEDQSGEDEEPSKFQDLGCPCSGKATCLGNCAILLRGPTQIMRQTQSLLQTRLQYGSGRRIRCPSAGRRRRRRGRQREHRVPWAQCPLVPHCSATSQTLFKEMYETLGTLKFCVASFKSARQRRRVAEAAGGADKISMRSVRGGTARNIEKN